MGGRPCDVVGVLRPGVGVQQHAGHPQAQADELDPGVGQVVLVAHAHQRQALLRQVAQVQAELGAGGVSVQAWGLGQRDGHQLVPGVGGHVVGQAFVPAQALT